MQPFQIAILTFPYGTEYGFRTHYGLIVIGGPNVTLNLLPNPGDVWLLV